MFLFIGILLSLIEIIFAVIISRKHNRNPWLWGILTCIFGFLSLGILLVLTRRKVIGYVLLSIYATITILAIVGYVELSVMGDSIG